MLLHNRGMGFRTDPGPSERDRAGKRPMHTIIPAMLYRDGRPVMPFGVMGGHYQATGHAHFISQILDRGRSLQAASDAPRSFAFDGKLSLRSTIAPDSQSRSGATRSHRRMVGLSRSAVRRRSGSIAARGVLIGASDHRKDGMALGL